MRKHASKSPTVPKTVEMRPKLTIHSNEGLAYRTNAGKFYLGKIEDFARSPEGKSLEGQVQLIFTSPPFALNKKKKYGNVQGEDYVEWLAQMAPILKKFLKPNGSIVLELGNAWSKGKPVMDPLSLRALLAFLERGNLNLCQQFIGYNKARLPTPAEWVTIRRIRVKDSFTHIWWMSPRPRPYASNRNVPKKYGKDMERLLETQSYNAGRRPSEHVINSTSFLKRNKGAIPSNVIEFSNTRASDGYMKFCKQHRIPYHPARMSREIPEFFIKFLTRKGQIVMDPFAGSNTTGDVAESLRRRWVSIDPVRQYVSGSRGRFGTVRVERALK